VIIYLIHFSLTQTCDKINGLYAFYANHIADRLLLQAHHSDLTLVRDQL
jgi:hypothetical protein